MTTHQAVTTRGPRRLQKQTASPAPSSSIVLEQCTDSEVIVGLREVPGCLPQCIFDMRIGTLLQENSDSL